jgi:hypothetical protein
MLQNTARTVFLGLVLSITGCASGSALVTGTKRDPVPPESVKLYTENPAEFEVIAIVKASSDAGWTEQGSVDYALAELKKQAAKVGANGVLLEATGTKTSTVIGSSAPGLIYAIPVDSQTLSGRAIYVVREK